MHKLLILGDVRLYRDGLSNLLGERENIHVLGTAASLLEAKERIATTSPDLILVDMAMRHSLIVVEKIANLAPEAKIIALTLPELENAILVCAEAGVAGYVTRDSSIEGLVSVIESAAVGEIQCSPRLAGRLFSRVSKLSMRHQQLSLESLTTREMDVLRQIEQGLSNKDIAYDLGIKLSTVKNHVHRLLDKLGVHRRTDAAALVRGVVPSAELLREPAWARPIR